MKWAVQLRLPIHRKVTLPFDTPRASTRRGCYYAPMQRTISQVDLPVDALERDLVSQAIDARWLTEGPFSRDFQKAIGELTGAKHVFFAPNGTLALFLAGLALD